MSNEFHGISRVPTPLAFFHGDAAFAAPARRLDATSIVYPVLRLVMQAFRAQSPHRHPSPPHTLV